MNNLTKQVEQILTEYPETRNDDITLTMQIWKTFYPHRIFIFGGHEAVLIKHILDLPREDHVKRMRAVIQNVEHRLLPTDINIFIERAKLSKEWKNRLGYQGLYKWSDDEWATALKAYDFTNDKIIKKNRKSKKTKNPCPVCYFAMTKRVEAELSPDKPNTMETKIWYECGNCNYKENI